MLFTGVPVQGTDVSKIKKQYVMTTRVRLTLHPAEVNLITYLCLVLCLVTGLTMTAEEGGVLAASLRQGELAPNLHASISPWTDRLDEGGAGEAIGSTHRPG